MGHIGIGIVGEEQVTIMPTKFFLYDIALDRWYQTSYSFSLYAEQRQNNRYSKVEKPFKKQELGWQMKTTVKVRWS